MIDFDEAEIEQFRYDCLNQHNHYRYLHRSLPLVLDMDLCESASFWAEFIADQNKLIYSESPFYGQNLFKSLNRAILGRDAAIAWYRTMKFFDFDTFGYNPRSRNFLQIVWKNSRQFGVGVALKNGIVWVVAHYRPGLEVNRNAMLENVFPSRIKIREITLLDLLYGILQEEIILKVMWNLIFESIRSIIC